MNRAVIICLLAVVALSMSGCPIYPSDNLCHGHWDCAPGYTCDEVSGACLAPTPSCTKPADCTGQSETCAPDGTCQIGSCHTVGGCVAGYSCAISKVDSTWICVAGSTGASAGGSTGSGGTASMGGTAGNSAGAGGSTATTGGSTSISGLSGTGGLPAAGGST